MSRLPNVLVYEFYTGGDSPPGDVSAGLAAEALGMLRAALSDFRSWRGVYTLTALDHRFAPAKLPADEVVCVGQGEYEKVFASLLRRCDAVLVIAPETGGVLASLTAQAEEAGKIVLGSSSAAVRIAGDKAECGRFFCEANLPAPEMWVSRFAGLEEIAQEAGYPLVIKPVDGVGCEGVCLVRSCGELPRAAAISRCATVYDQVLVQRYVDGIHVSVSALVAGGKCLPLSLNHQLIEPGLPFHYSGVQVLFDHKLGGRASDVACEAISLIAGLKGYVGVDLVLTEDEIFLIEINPRLTASYIGLQQLAGRNLSRMIFDVCVNSVFPGSVL